jgi:hypothetical protein
MFMASASIVTLAMCSSTALAGADDGGTLAHEGDGPALYLTIGDDCQEDYAAELSAVGLSVHVSRYKELESLGRFVEVPKDVSIKHLMLVKGFVIVNHVPPEAIISLIAAKPKVRGLIGSAACAAGVDHDQLHMQATRPF